MATTTPNYGWTVPTSTDLVKDGATAIETLGDAIDASMNTALGTKKAGMVLLNTTSFSAVSSVSLPANTFTSAYKNYKFVFNCVGSTFSLINLRMRASGSDNSSNNYKWTNLSSQFALANGNWTPVGNTTLQSSILFTYMYNGFPTYMEGIIYNPQATEYTSLNAYGNYLQDATTGGYSQYTNGALTVTTSYDSFSLIPASGNMTGSISIFGVNA